jgi:hypothetical protein
MSRLDKMKNKPQPGLRQQMAQVVPTTVPRPISTEGIPSKEQVNQRKNINQFTEILQDPTQINKNTIKEALKASVIKEARSPELNKTKKEIENEYSKALVQYNKDKDAAKWGQFAERMGQALTQLGAGAYGLKHGTDLSGIKFDKTDWKSNLDSALQDLKQATDKKKEQISNKEGRESSILGKLANLRKLEIADTPAEEQIPEGMSELDREKLAIEREKLGLRREEMTAKAKSKELESKNKPKTINKAQETRDKEFGKEYAKMVGNPSQASASRRNIEQLDNAIARIQESGSVSGGVLQRFPEFMRSFIDRKGLDIQQTIEQVVQQDLRATLGAQFTEREGERLIARAYNKDMPEKENLRRLKLLSKQMKKAANNQKEAIEYFENNNTLEGFKKKLYKSEADFDLGTDPKPGVNTPEADKRARLEELRAKKRGK